mgnify:CR=1 FL=1
MSELLHQINLSYLASEEEPPTVIRDKASELPGVGFHPRIEVEVLRKDLLKGDSVGESKEEILRNWLEKSKRNLSGYWQEYIDQKLVLPIEIEFAEVEGQKRVVSKGIKNATWIDSVSERERNGSIKDSARKIEEFLLASPPNSTAVLVSPGGREYPDTQTYIYCINSDGEIDAMTIRTDPNLEDNESFLLNSDTNFSPETNIPLDLRVEKIIRNPLFLRSFGNFGFSPESIIETIRQTKGAQGAFKDKGFEKLFSDFKKRFDVLEAGHSIKVVIDEFCSFCHKLAKEHSFVFSDEAFGKIEGKLGETVLKMSYIKRHLQGRGLDQAVITYRLHNLRSQDYENELRHLQTIPGCAGGGLGNYVNNGLGLREIAGGLGMEDQYGSLEFRCDKCGGANSRPFGHLISNCQHCGADVRC